MSWLNFKGKLRKKEKRKKVISDKQYAEILIWSYWKIMAHSRIIYVCIWNNGLWLLGWKRMEWWLEVDLLREQESIEELMVVGALRTSLEGARGV